MRRRTTKLLIKVIGLSVILTFMFLLISPILSPTSQSEPSPQSARLKKSPLIKEDSVNVVGEVPKNIGPRKDWHDYDAMEKDFRRKGLGEGGMKAKLHGDAKMEKLMFSQNGFNAMLSDAISVNRSVLDIRHPGCKTKTYVSHLPTTSIILIFYNEHFSVLIRSIYSILNRSPPELVKEIIIVDDCSDRETLKQNLDDFVAKNLPKVKIVRLHQRTGLIGARMAGARAATAEVLIFFDSHIETNYNWLPPLLEPIALNPKASVCPFIDVIDHTTFEYRAQDEGARGAFDWEFYYKRLALLPEDLVDKTKPFRSPIMAGGLFAIGAKFFWELEGYDEGLDIWGGEQYELSFKIWMCGGELLDAPCSRVAHIYRGPMTAHKNPRTTDYVHVNYKRVAEVWMDEYKQYLYDHSYGLYEKLDAGDLTKQKALRERLKCKSFKWFMEEIAFDLAKTYPPVEPPDFAHGTLRSAADPRFCVDTMNQKLHSPVGMYYCASDSKRPQRNQFWALSWHRDMRIKNKKECMDVSVSGRNAPVALWECHGQGGNQFWYYDAATKLLKHGSSGDRCLEADVTNRKVYVNTCDDTNERMIWTFGFVNDTALKTFFSRDEEEF